jgi:ATP-binding cassette, subfamily B, bacterial PglK
LIPNLSTARELTRRIYSLAKPFGRKQIGMVFIFSIAQGIFQVLGVTSIFPFLALAADPGKFREARIGAYLLEKLPAISDQEMLLIAGVFALLMLFISNAVCLLSEVNRSHYARHYGHWLRVNLLRRIASRPYGDFLLKNSGVFLKKVTNDVTQYTIGVLLPALDCFARAITVVLLLVMLVAINPSVAIGAASIFGMFYLAIFRILGAGRRQINDGVKDANRGVVREAQQLLGGIKAIKVHQTEEYFLQAFSSHSEEQARLSAWLPVYSNGPRYLIEPLAFGGVVALVLFYAARGEDFTELLPTLGVMALAGYRLLPAFQVLYAQATTLATTRHALDELFDEFSAVENRKDLEIRANSFGFLKPNAIQWGKEITLDHLSFQYPKSKEPVINQLCMVIPKNSAIGIIGTTGSGKSTLVDLILGLHAPTSGQILVDGIPLSRNNHRAWRAGIGYVPQEIFLIDDTLAANIALGVPAAEVDRDMLRQAASAAQMIDFIERSPQGWESRVGERGICLSGGQRQRIGLARALYHRPSFLILDEATSALDNETEAEVMSAIDALQGSVTLLIIAHRLSTLRNCRSIIDLSSKVPTSSTVL